MKPSILSAGRLRTLDIPGLGSYELVTGQGYGAGDYGKSAWAFACMRIRSTALAELPWRITRNDEVVENHPLLELLKGMDFGVTEIDLLLKGAAFWLYDIDRLARLNPNTVEVKRSSKGIEKFVQTLDNRPRDFARDEVIYLREFHPTDDLGPGVPAVEVAKLAIAAEYESQRYIKSFFENDAVPGLLLHTAAEMMPDDINKLEAWWDRKFKGAKKHHKPAFMGQDFKADILTTDLRSMALEEVRDEARRDICTAFQVPMLLVGLMDESNYANAKEARLYLTESVIIPRSKYFATVINADLVQMIDADVVFEFATDELPILQEDKDAKALRLTNLKDKGIVSAQYVRQELGIPETAAPAEPAPVPETPADGQPGVFRSWERKASKALRAGKSADVPFETDEISPALQAAVRVRLGQAKTIADVEQVFRGAYP